MDILIKLHKEHMVVKKLVKQMVDSDSSSRRTKLFAKFKTALVKHSRSEEKVVYDAISRLRGEKNKQESAEGYIEHSLVDVLLKKLGAAKNKSTVEWTAGIKVVKELLEHHIKEEQEEVFDTVRKHFSVAERADMNKAFEAHKKTVKA
jgi:hemerythrin superfamily protein